LAANQRRISSSTSPSQSCHVRMYAPFFRSFVFSNSLLLFTKFDFR
jgi:hypothetical protein